MCIVGVYSASHTPFDMRFELYILGTLLNNIFKGFILGLEFLNAG